MLLSVPALDLDKLNLEVEHLKAKVALKAGVGNLLNLEVGADVTISDVKLEIEGVETEAHLRVRLKRVQEILRRTLETLDNNPDMVKFALESADEQADKTTEEVREGAGELE